jgi:hypothetical protein
MAAAASLDLDTSRRPDPEAALRVQQLKADLKRQLSRSTSTSTAPAGRPPRSPPITSPGCARCTRASAA